MNPHSEHFHLNRTASTQAIQSSRVRRRRRRTDLHRLARRVREPRGPSSLQCDRRPHGHVIGHATAEPLPATLDGLPHGHVVAAGNAHVQTFDGGLTAM
jgi:hypothetical protein